MIERGTAAMSSSPPITPIPFPDFREMVLATYKSKSQSAYHSMRRALDIMEGLRIETTAELTNPALLDRFVAALKGREDRTIAGYLVMIQSACSLAIRWGHLETSPFGGNPDLARWMRCATHRDPRPSPAPARVKALLAQLKAEAAGDLSAHRSYVLAALVAYTGVLRNEALTIRVDAIDFVAETIRLFHRNGRARSLPMPGDLACILRDWLRREIRYRGVKLDRKQAAEVRRFHAEGWTKRALAKKFGMAEETIRGILAGKHWRDASAETGMPSRIVDQEWLFPNLRIGDPGHWRGDVGPSSSHRISVACRAVGIEELTFSDLRMFYRDHIAAGTVPDRPHAGGGASPPPPVTPCPVALYGRERSVVVNGRRKPRLTRGRYDVLKVLADAWPDGVTKFELEGRSGHFTAAVKILRQLKRSDPDFDAVIKLPGRNYREGYSLMDPRETI